MVEPRQVGGRTIFSPLFDKYHKKKAEKKRQEAEKKRKDAIRAQGKDPDRPKVQYTHDRWEGSGLASKSWYDYPPLDASVSTHRTEYVGMTAEEVADNKRAIDALKNAEWYKKWRAVNASPAVQNWVHPRLRTGKAHNDFVNKYPEWGDTEELAELMA